VDNTEAIRELASDEYGVVVMAASTGQEVSIERPEWKHGAFTKALLEGLQEGRADLSQDGIVHLTELDHFIAEKVKELTQGEQHPTHRNPLRSAASRLRRWDRNKERNAAVALGNGCVALLRFLFSSRRATCL